MELICKFKENEKFERSLRSNYSTQVSELVIEWCEECLFYVFKETSNERLFKLGRINEKNKSITYSDEIMDLKDILHIVLKKIEESLDSTDSWDIVEDELKMILNAIHS